MPMMTVMSFRIFVLVFAVQGLAAGVLSAAPSPQTIESTARWLESQGIRYAGSWLPPGESRAWSMDCSNAVRWFYRELWGGELPRTASDQYLHFRREGKFRRARPDAVKLAGSLQPGDFLFWEHTYKPRRKPPVTHVMMYLGRDASGRMWMAGAQGSRGVRVYEFRPKGRMGGYNWFLWFRREGRFIGYARP
jgi:cell wall-associated NlpC family hydrolase